MPSITRRSKLLALILSIAFVTPVSAAAPFDKAPGFAVSSWTLLVAAWDGLLESLFAPTSQALDPNGFSQDASVPEPPPLPSTTSDEPVA
jgi:hypothetical protein